MVTEWLTYLAFNPLLLTSVAMSSNPFHGTMRDLQRTCHYMTSRAVFANNTYTIHNLDFKYSIS